MIAASQRRTTYIGTVYRNIFDSLLRQSDAGIENRADLLSCEFPLEDAQKFRAKHNQLKKEIKTLGKQQRRKIKKHKSRGDSDEEESSSEEDDTMDSADDTMDSADDIIDSEEDVNVSEESGEESGEQEDDGESSDSEENIDELEEEDEWVLMDWAIDI